MYILKMYKRVVCQKCRVQMVTNRLIWRNIHNIEFQEYECIICGNTVFIEVINYG